MHTVQRSRPEITIELSVSVQTRDLISLSKLPSEQAVPWFAESHCIPTVLHGIGKRPVDRNALPPMAVDACDPLPPAMIGLVAISASPLAWSVVRYTCWI